MIPSASTLLRVPLVALAALAVVLGLGIGSTATARSGQEWGFLATPTSVPVGWQGQLTVAWRNIGDEAQTYRVTLDGVDVDFAWSTEVTAESGESFRRELPLPRLAAAGTYRARLSVPGAADDLATTDLLVRLPARVVDVRRSAAAVSPGSGPRAERRVTTSFAVSRSAAVDGRVVDATGRTVARRSFGTHGADERMRWTWDGRDAAGRAVVAGRYTMVLRARAGGGSTDREVALHVRR